MTDNNFFLLMLTEPIILIVLVVIFLLVIYLIYFVATFKKKFKARIERFATELSLKKIETPAIRGLKQIWLGGNFQGKEYWLTLIKEEAYSPVNGRNLSHMAGILFIPLAEKTDLDKVFVCLKDFFDSSSLVTNRLAEKYITSVLSVVVKKFVSSNSIQKDDRIKRGKNFKISPFEILFKNYFSPPPFSYPDQYILRLSLGEFSRLKPERIIEVVAKVIELEKYGKLD